MSIFLGRIKKLSTLRMALRWPNGGDRRAAGVRVGMCGGGGSRPRHRVPTASAWLTGRWLCSGSTFGGRAVRVEPRCSGRAERRGRSDGRRADARADPVGGPAVGRPQPTRSNGPNARATGRPVRWATAGLGRPYIRPDRRPTVSKRVSTAYMVRGSYGPRGVWPSIHTRHVIFVTAGSWLPNSAGACSDH